MFGELRRKRVDQVNKDYFHILNEELQQEDNKHSEILENREVEDSTLSSHRRQVVVRLYRSVIRRILDPVNLLMSNCS